MAAASPAIIISLDSDENGWKEMAVAIPGSPTAGDTASVVSLPEAKDGLVRGYQVSDPKATAMTTTASKKESSRLSGNSSSVGKNGIETEYDTKLAEEKPQGDRRNVYTTHATPSPLTTSVSSTAAAAAAAIDPLSQHIYLRTNTDPIPFRLRTPSKPDSPEQLIDGPVLPSIDASPEITASNGDVTKDRRKGVSFLSRINIRGNKKKLMSELDSESEFGSEAPMNGINARVFSQVVGGSTVGMGYSIHHKEPPRYIRTKTMHKKNKEFHRMFLAQELLGTRPAPDVDEMNPNASLAVPMPAPNGPKASKMVGAIWATEFSKDGKFFAAAGRDNVVRIWAVISTREERQACEEEQLANGDVGERLSAPVFMKHPIREFYGHTGEVLDLSWSKNNFLLSSSMDKTVRLWHTSRQECLCAFKHKDFVTKLAFHPRDDRFFLAGSLDTMLRLWSIPDKTIAYSAELPDFITAVSFSPDGKTAIAGLLNGVCQFFETEGLKMLSQIHVRSSRGKNAKGSKITGIQTIQAPFSKPVTAWPSQPSSLTTSRASTEVTGAGEVKVLITSNDSRVRIYNLRDKTLQVKFKGHENACSQIAASFSDDGKYVICGSEDRKAFIWSSGESEVQHLDRDKLPCEYFEAHNNIVTTALFAPTATRRLLGQGGDPVYELCNPPPVTLRSLEESASTTGSHVATSLEELQLPSTPTIADTKKAGESPAYIARSAHRDGSIIITSDGSGAIKIFRQDCAALKRRQENWDTGSAFSRKLGANSLVGCLGRTGSIMTRYSAGSAAQSQRGSLNHSPVPGMIASPQIGIHAVSDRILSWRQGIENGGDKRGSPTSARNARSAGDERSSSPSKTHHTPSNSRRANVAGNARNQDHAGAPAIGGRANGPPSRLESKLTPTPSESEQRQPSQGMVSNTGRNFSKENGKDSEGDSNVSPSPAFSVRPCDDKDESRIDPVQSGTSFWNINRWRPLAGLRASISGQSVTVPRPRDGNSVEPAEGW